MSSKKSDRKKDWLRERFDDGLVLYRSEERRKCFIEYIPAENAWHPLDAGGYLHIDCLKVIYFVEYFFVLNAKKYSNTISFLRLNLKNLLIPTDFFAILLPRGDTHDLPPRLF